MIWVHEILLFTQSKVWKSCDHLPSEHDDRTSVYAITFRLLSSYYRSHCTPQPAEWAALTQEAMSNCFFRGFRFHNVAPLTSCLLLGTNGPWCAPAGWSADLLERRGCAASCRRWDVAPSRRRWARRPYSAAGSPGSTPAAERRYKPVGVYVSHLPVWTRIFGVHPASKF